MVTLALSPLASWAILAAIAAGIGIWWWLAVREPDDVDDVLAGVGWTEVGVDPVDVRTYPGPYDHEQRGDFA